MEDKTQTECTVKLDDTEIVLPRDEIPKVKKPSLSKLYRKEMSIGELRESYKKTKKYCVLTPT